MKKQINPWWLVGLVDGNGNFEIKNESTNPSLSFNIVLDSSDYQLLHKIKKHFGCGRVFKSSTSVPGGPTSKASGESSEKKNENTNAVYEVVDTVHLNERIRPFFEKYTPESKLKISWIKFRRVLIWLERDIDKKVLVEKATHLKTSGFKRESKPL